MLKKLRIQFIISTMGIATVMLGVILGMLYHFTARDLEADSLRLVQQLATQPTLPERPAPPGAGPEELNLPYFVVLLDQRGNAVTTAGGYYDLSDEAFLDRVLEAAGARPEQSGVLEEYSLRFFKSGSPQGQKIVFADTSSQTAALHSLVRTSLFIGLASLLALFGLSLLLAHAAVKPVERAWQQQRLFVADASHELKTPLTVIMTNAELLQNREYDPAEHSRFAENILSMSRQMRGLVEALLDLARVDAGRDGMDFQELELSELVRDGLLPFEPLFFESGLELKSSIAPDLRIRGSARGMQQVLDILLDNAMKYSPSGAVVELSLRRQGSHCLLSVKNPGQSLSREELKAIFKRFYRSDKARSLNGSYGLGLPIARSILASHRGKIWAESREGQIIFNVLLPML